MAHSPSFVYVGLAKQAVAGTPVAPTKFFKISAVTGKPMIKQIFFRDGQNRDFIQQAKSQQWVEGTFSTYMYCDEFTPLLAYTIAATDGVTGAGDPYTHAGSSAAVSAPPLITIEFSQGNLLDVTRVTDCYIKELKLVSKAGELVKVDATYVGRIGVPGTTASTVVYSVDRPLEPSDATLTFTGLSVSGTDVTELTIDIKQAIQLVPVHGSLAPQLMPAGRDVLVDFTVFVPDAKLYRDVFYGGDAATVAVAGLTTLTTLVAKWDVAGTPDHFVQLTLKNVQSFDAVPKFDPNGTEFTIAAKGQCTYDYTNAVVAYSNQNLVALAY